MIVLLVVILGVVVVVGIALLITRKQPGGRPEKHFDVGVVERYDIPKRDEVWQEGAPTTGGEPVDVTLNPRPEEETREDIQRETTEFADDLLDPRNPKHAEWEQREQERIARGQQDDPPPAPQPGTP